MSDSMMDAGSPLLALFRPYSAGSEDALRKLTVEAIHLTFPYLSDFIYSINGKRTYPIAIRAFPKSFEEKHSAEQIKIQFDRFGSDKSLDHDYHFFYGTILKKPHEIKSVLEIGLGTCHEDVVSTMGREGKPGASLRAFKAYLPNAMVFGADIDTRILFAEARIQTQYVDQNSAESLMQLGESLPDKLDLIIDDGLHAPPANINTLSFALNRIKIGGWVVIEDISPAAVPFWEVVTALLPSRFEPYLFQAQNGILFCVKRIA